LSAQSRRYLVGRISRQNRANPLVKLSVVEIIHG
jgi:hypothetical protein